MECLWTGWGFLWTAPKFQRLWHLEPIERAAIAAALDVCAAMPRGNTTAMYIGIGTIVLILLIVLAIWLIRGRAVV